MSSEGIWRWNVNDVWQSYSSMFQESALAKVVGNDIQRYHHVTACLLFGGCAIESFLNSSRRVQLEKSGISDENITKELRYTSLQKKWRNGPQNSAGHLSKRMISR